MSLFSRLRNAKIGIPFWQVSLGRKARVRSRSSLKFVGSAYFGDKVSITARGGHIEFGNNFHANDEVLLNADIGGTLIFGSDCLIGPRCIFRTSNHNFSDVNRTIMDQGHTSGDIRVGDDVWLGANVIVLPGVTIGSHSVIGAGAVVTRDIPEFSVSAGNPAKLIRMRNIEKIEDN